MRRALVGISALFCGLFAAGTVAADCSSVVAAKSRKYSELQCLGDTVTGVRFTARGQAVQYTWNLAGTLLSRARAGDGVGTTALADVCPATRALKRGEIYKTKQSPHIPSGDSRKNSTAFITTRGTPAPSGKCLTMYDSNGTAVHKMGRYNNTNPEYTSRYYGGTGCGDRKRPTRIGNVVNTNTGSYQGYLKVGTRTCVVIPDVRRCYNSSGC